MTTTTEEAAPPPKKGGGFAAFSNLFIPFGLLLGGGLLLAETRTDLTIARAVNTIIATIIVVTPALALYPLRRFGKGYERHWFWSWVLGYLAYIGWLARAAS